jgi:hypothetical protein
MSNVWQRVWCIDRFSLTGPRICFNRRLCTYGAYVLIIDLVLFSELSVCKGAKAEPRRAAVITLISAASEVINTLRL